MSETGGLESFSPDEGAGSASEQLSEEAKARFAASAAAMQAIKREEKRSKKRDDRVARTIIQFLNDDRYAHLFVLISRLVARDCPSVFIIAVLSLISDDSRKVVSEYLTEHGQKSEQELMETSMQLTKSGELDGRAHVPIVAWITRMQMILSLETLPILLKLMVDEKNIDGTVLQLATFVLQAFFRSEDGGRKDIPFEKLHSLTASILQTVFSPFMGNARKAYVPKPKEGSGDE